MACAYARLAPQPIVCGVVTGPRIGTGELPDGFEWYAGGHPLPNAQSETAGRRALALARDVGTDHSLVVLLSGGASAHLVVPADTLSRDDKAATTRALMLAGVPIDRLNSVRRHISAIKGGRLGAAAFRSVTLAVSDVHAPVPDDPSTIGSGPTAADSTTFADAMDIVQRAGVVLPPSVMRYLERGCRGEVEETIKPGDDRLSRARYVIIGNRHTATAAAGRVAQAAGYTVEILAEATSGEARDASKRFVAHAKAIASGAARPLCVIGSGETTVRVTGQGKGGRNQEFALAATLSIGSVGRAALLGSVGTDGVDGPTDAAGAMVDSSTLARAERAGVDWQRALAENDAYSFFAPLADLVIAGPTGTNVGDLHVMLIA